MSQYYFLVASLPSLTYDTAVAHTPQQFLEMVREHATASDYEAVRSASIDAPAGIDARYDSVRQWQRFETGLRNALVRLRTPAKGVEADSYLRRDPDGRDYTDLSGVTEAARAAVSEVSPLTGEHDLGKARWAFLDELEVGHFFDVEKLIVYYLRLQLIARLRQLNRDDGERLYRAATDKIMTDYYQEQGDQ